MLPHSTSSSTYTCISCRIEFPSMETQRFHMKTEWHRYNLKRRITSLNPITYNEFMYKLSHKQEEAKYDDFGFLIEEKKKKKGNLRYDLLNRGRRRAPQTRDSSPASSVHSHFSLSTMKSELGDDSDVATDTTKDVTTDYNTEEETDTDVEQEMEVNEPLLITQCIYCSLKNDDIESNLQHMLQMHGLYIPNKDMVNDIEGMVRYLSDLVVVDKECIKCGFVSNKLLGIRQHIQAKGHACVPYETVEDRAFFSQYYIEEEDDDDEDGELVVDETGVELALPNGYKLGHRSMNRYYRQNVANERKMSEGEMTVMVMEKENAKLAHYAETVEHRKRVKEVGLINGLINNREFSTNSLQYKNNLKYYQNQKFG